jgi:hypothetical protein
LRAPTRDIVDFASVASVALSVSVALARTDTEATDCARLLLRSRLRAPTRDIVDFAPRRKEAKKRRKEFGRFGRASAPTARVFDNRRFRSAQKGGEEEEATDALSVASIALAHRLRASFGFGRACAHRYRRSRRSNRLRTDAKTEDRSERSR